MLGLLTVGDGFIYLALLDHGGINVTWFPLLLRRHQRRLPAAGGADRPARRPRRPGARSSCSATSRWSAAYLCSVLPTSTAAATVGTLALLGVFYAATDGIIAAIAGRLVPVQARTTGIAAAQTVVAVARMLASAGFGLLWLLLGPTAAMATVAAVLAVAVVVAATAGRAGSTPPRSRREPR